MSRVKFRYQKPYKNIYRVGEKVGIQNECLFTTIQAAINAAIADGYTDSTNPALIEIYPKTSGPYVEDLTLNAGVNLRGMDAQNVVIQGNHIWLPSVGGQPQNRLFIENLNMNGVAGAATFIFGGSSNARIFFKNCFIAREGLDDGLGTFVMNNGSTASRVILTDTEIYHFANAGAGICADFLRGRLIMAGKSAIGAEGPSGNYSLRMNNNANVFCRAQGGNGASDSFYTESGAQVVEFNNNSNVFNLIYGTMSNFNGGAIFNFNAAAAVTLATVGLNSGSSLAIGPATGSIFFLNPVVQTGDAASSSYGGDYGLNGTPNNLTVRPIPSGMRVDYKDGMLNGYVGFSYGYPTIQAAINQLAIFAAGNFFKVKLADGTTFTENVNLFGGCILEGVYESDLIHNSTPSRIDGKVSFTAGLGGPAQVLLRNLKIVAPNGDRAFQYNDSGAFGECKFENCIFEKAGDPAVAETVLLDGSGGGGGKASLITCVIRRTEVDVGIALSAIDINIIDNYDCIYTSYGVGVGIASNNRLVRNQNSRFDANYSYFTSFTEKSFEVVDSLAIFQISHSTIEAAVERGEVFRFTNNGSVYLYSCVLTMSNILPGSVVARDGVQAAGNFAFAGNVYVPGDGININGVNFINGVDFVVGGSTAATVANIAAAINASVNPSIQNVVYAIASGTTLEIYGWNYSAAANAITLAVVGTAPAVASGATLTGGVTGAGGLFVYDCAFGRNLIQNTLNVQQLTRNLVAI